MGNEIIYSTEVLKSNQCGYSDAYILIRRNITVIGRNLATKVAFKNCAPFVKCIKKIDGTTTDDVVDLDLVMPMYKLLEYSSNYSDTTGNLWFYSKDDAVSFSGNIVSNSKFKTFEYKTRLIGNTGTDGAN